MKVCAECQSPAKARGLCRVHYLRAYRRLALGPVREYGRKHNCADCGTPCGPCGRCPTHHKAWRRTQRMLNPPCDGPLCERDAECSGLCNAHRMQVYQRGGREHLTPLGTIRRRAEKTA